ncbi:MAG: 3-dehydroquinate dehydratase [Methanoregulaceae archaeon PtaU1.Bin222]|nr:MAG: 3-dehydroquinate dehydratase [Methanoregulaceae archaeon PtaU1.Bin222]
MQCVVSVPGLDLIPRAISEGADIIEIRLDLTGYIPEETAHASFSDLPVPLIFTIRSVREGGLFTGGHQEWWNTLLPCIPYAKYVDIEDGFKPLASRLKGKGISTISSVHTHSMPDGRTLATLESRLRSFGDIPKIVVAPETRDDVLSLLSFTHHAEKPIATSIMGTKFRHARLLLPLFGSSLIYCHCGTAASPGQYHVREWREFCRLLKDH